MERGPRFAFTPLQKVILWVGFVLCVWRFLQVPAIFDAILKFCAAGQIPGTDVSLPPDAVLWIVFGACVAGVLVLFYRLFLRVPADYHPAPHPAPERQPRIRATASLSAITRAWQQLTARVLPWSAKLQLWVTLAAASLLPFVRQRLAVIRKHGITSGRYAWRATCRMAGICRRAAVAFWVFAEPHIRRSDAWLRERLNHYTPTARLIQAVRAVVGVGHEAAGKPAESRKHERG